MRHVEMYDGRPWCEGAYLDPAHAVLGPDYVTQGDWHASPTGLVGATCLDCLRTIFTLGQWARNVLSSLRSKEKST